MSFLIWNTRGLNNPTRRNDLNLLLKRFNVSLLGLLETKFSSAAIDRYIATLPPQWGSVDNRSTSDGGRIVVVYNLSVWSVSQISISSQHITLACTNSAGLIGNLTIVYTDNSVAERSSLWRSLVADSITISYAPWLIAGDFNCVRSQNEK